MVCLSQVAVLSDLWELVVLAGCLHGEPLLCADVSKEERYFPLDEKIRSEMAAPLSEGNRTVGALNVDALEVKAFSSDDLRLLVLIANEASRVLENMDGPTIKA